MTCGTDTMQARRILVQPHAARNGRS